MCVFVGVDRRLAQTARLKDTSAEDLAESSRIMNLRVTCAGPRGLWITGDNTATAADFDRWRTDLDSKKACLMALTLDDVNRIAQLARLELQPGEQAAMLTQLNGFFRVVEQMSAVDTSGVEPLYTPLSAVQDVQLRLREDAVTETSGLDERSANQRSAPSVEDGLFLVPKVMVA
jgi:aspartyl-tRNA(Asn)/glutamyl-tRNA(Gln) amidotransferase subunit C